MLFTAGLWINLDDHGKLVGLLTSKISCFSGKFVLQFMSATLNGRICFNGRLLHLSSVWKHYVANTLEAGRMPVSTKYSLAKVTVCTCTVCRLLEPLMFTLMHMYICTCICTCVSQSRSVICSLCHLQFVFAGFLCVQCRATLTTWWTC